MNTVWNFLKTNSRGGGNYLQDSRGTPRILRGGVNNPNNPPYLLHCKDLMHYITLTDYTTKKERERNGLSEGPRSRTERNDFKKVGMCPALIQTTVHLYPINEDDVLNWNGAVPQQFESSLDDHENLLDIEDELNTLCSPFCCKT